MVSYDLTSLASKGYLYLACDRSGSLWAYKVMPIRGSGPTEGFWVLPKEMHPPEISDFPTIEEWKEAYRDHWERMRRMGRQCLHIGNIFWEDEPVKIEDILLSPGK
ncbi:MAG: hypothetical protein IKL29_07140 [Bacteroidaceae bacterium]|nr:hypothetical protein [Bacteroidaceae bacterium]